MLILFRHLFIFERLLCGENSFFFVMNLFQLLIRMISLHV